ncbi:MAG: hypothetical protein MZV64_44845 [Ignavibacteriales bacterium]|nr:hypothetical protein [Ignavibacteriales bacterium]
MKSRLTRASTRARSRRSESSCAAECDARRRAVSDRRRRPAWSASRCGRLRGERRLPRSGRPT